MLAECQAVFAECDGLIGVAAPCDYRPVKVAPSKISKTGEPLRLQLIETPDVVATLGGAKERPMARRLRPGDRGSPAAGVGKAGEKELRPDGLQRAPGHERRETEVEIIDRRGQVLAHLSGTKEEVATGIFRIIQTRLIDSRDH